MGGRKFEAAIQRYEEAISVNPQLASGFAALGLTLQMQVRTQQWEWGACDNTHSDTVLGATVRSQMG